ncbi:hypothetical protein BC940DRAFT_296042 [Gongronella butleri]|nr:hypothetical protein BC940DRAFT_296042 [Gongronella butleri]
MDNDDARSTVSAPELVPETKNKMPDFSDFRLDPFHLTFDSRMLYDKRLDIDEKRRTLALYLEPEEDTALAYSLHDFQERSFIRFGPNYAHNANPHVCLIPNMVVERGSDTGDQWQSVIEQVKQVIQKVLDDHRAAMTPPAFAGYHVQTSASAKQERSVSLCLRLDPAYEKISQAIQTRLAGPSTNKKKVRTNSTFSKIRSVSGISQHSSATTIASPTSPKSSTFSAAIKTTKLAKNKETKENEKNEKNDDKQDASEKPCLPPKASSNGTVLTNLPTRTSSAPPKDASAPATPEPKKKDASPSDDGDAVSTPLPAGFPITFVTPSSPCLLDRMVLASYPTRLSTTLRPPSRLALKKIRDMAKDMIEINDWVRNGTNWKITLYEVMLECPRVVGVKEQLKKIHSWPLRPVVKSKSFGLPVMFRIKLAVMSSWFRVSPVVVEPKRIQAAAVHPSTQQAVC